jgi:hypothetical protein
MWQRDRWMRRRTEASWWRGVDLERDLNALALAWDSMEVNVPLSLVVDRASEELGAAEELEVAVTANLEARCC